MKNTSIGNSIMGILLLVIGGVGLLAGMMIYSVLVNALVVSYLWGWFAIPLGAPAISCMHAAGISVAISYITTTSQQSIKKEYRENSILWMALLRPWLVLLTGYAIHQFI